MNRERLFDTSYGLDQLRFELLNRIIIGTGVITGFSLLLIIITELLNVLEQTATFNLVLVVINLIILILYMINRKGHVVLAGSLFVFVLSMSFLVADEPREILVGRSLFMFIFPIMVASFVLRNYASFIVATYLTVVHLYMWFGGIVQIDWEFSPFGMIAFFAFAFVAWLAANNLEKAIVDRTLALRKEQEITDRLDSLVIERTKELKNANIELAEANDELKTLDLLKSKFVSDVSHELRTPVSNIKIYLEMLQLSSNPDKNKRYLDVLVEVSDQLDGLLEDILDLSRLESSEEKDVSIQSVDLNTLVQQVVQSNILQAESKGLELTQSLQEDMPPLQADSKHVLQILNNLVVNGIRYTSEGFIKVSTDIKDDLVIIQVEDSGDGIHDEDIPHIFERFYRGQEASQSTIPGSGLGLAIIDDIVSRYGGKIELKSEKGKGSIFTVSLPQSYHPLDGDS